MASYKSDKEQGFFDPLSFTEILIGGPSLMLLKFFQREQQRNRRRVGLEREGSALEDLTIAFLQALNAPALWILKGLKKEKGRERFTDSRSR